MTGQDREPPVQGVGTMLGSAAVLAAVLWLIPHVVCLAYSARWPDLTLLEAITGTARIATDSQWAEPALAYPARARAVMPGATGWWAATAWLLVTAGCAAVGTWRRLEPVLARERLGRRPYDVRGARPRAWGRPRDFVGTNGGFRIGRLDRRIVTTDEEAHVAVVAPTRAGKTSRCIIPWLLDHDGPAIVTSTKRDVLDATFAQRRSLGAAYIYDPLGAPGSSCWTPLFGCADWSYALRQAQWLADATQDGESEIARYWRGEAAKLLAPLLHAAALGRRSIGDVLTWLDRQNTNEPNRYLAAEASDAARLQLQAVDQLDPRNRGTTYMSAASVLAAYRFPEVIATARPEITTSGFLDGRCQTLYIVSSERHQRLLAPLIVALISSLLNAAMERAHGPRGFLKVLLDEAANIAPLQDLPRLLAQAGGHGIRFATAWQSVGQLRARYGHDADSVLANSTAKLFMGPITDPATRGFVSDLLGSEPVEHGDRWQPKGRPGALQQLGPDRALLVSSHTLPAVVTIRPWWEESRFRARGSRSVSRARRRLYAPLKWRRPLRRPAGSARWRSRWSSSSES